MYGDPLAKQPSPVGVSSLEPMLCAGWRSLRDDDIDSVTLLLGFGDLGFGFVTSRKGGRRQGWR